MNSPTTLTHLHHKNTSPSNKNVKTISKRIIFVAISLVPFYVFFFNHHLSFPLEISTSTSTELPTNITHLAFGIAGSVKLWKTRKPYIESWWRPNVTKGLLFLDREPIEFLPWAQSSPPYALYGDTSRFKPYDKHGMPHAIRMVMVVQEAFRKVRDRGIRWFVMADDDTVLFLDNLVDVLGRYDHRKYFYIGHNSESVMSNNANSFEVAFGGAGYALSYPLAEALAKNLDVCLKRYPYVYGSDHILQACVADLGVSLTHEKGFHQIDLRKDISGFLLAHPQSPLLSLHHLDTVDSLFPGMPRDEALRHLTKASSADQSRLLQQSICYHRNWSFSTAWGYSVQLYTKPVPPAFLMIPLETFSSWGKTSPHNYMFNTRASQRDPCDAPHVFYFESAKLIDGEGVVTSYTRRTARAPTECPPAGDVEKVLVFSPAKRLIVGVGNRRECCDVEDSNEKNVTRIKIRPCLRDEIMGLV